MIIPKDLTGSIQDLNELVSESRKISENSAELHNLNLCRAIDRLTAEVRQTNLIFSAFLTSWVMSDPDRDWIRYLDALSTYQIYSEGGSR